MIGATVPAKTTLLRIIAQHMVDPDAFRVLGASAFHDPALSGRIEFLRRAVPVRGRSAGRRDPGAPDRGRSGAARPLIEVLGVDLDGTCTRCPTGKRRRVQLLRAVAAASGAAARRDHHGSRPDRAPDLLAFLREESEVAVRRSCTRPTSSDTLDRWATDIVYLVAARSCSMRRSRQFPSWLNSRCVSAWSAGSGAIRASRSTMVGANIESLEQLRMPTKVVANGSRWSAPSRSRSSCSSPRCGGVDRGHLLDDIARSWPPSPPSSPSVVEPGRCWPRTRIVWFAIPPARSRRDAIARLRERAVRAHALRPRASGEIQFATTSWWGPSSTARLLTARADGSREPRGSLPAAMDVRRALPDPTRRTS